MDAEEEDVTYKAYGHRHGLARQLRITIDIAISTAGRPLLRALGSNRAGPISSARRELVERIVASLRGFDVRWKGDPDPDPEALAPWAKPHPLPKTGDET